MNSGPTTSYELAAHLRPVVASLAAALIPGGDGLPGADDVDVAGELMNRVLSVRPDLAQVVSDIAIRASTSVGGTGTTFLRKLERTDRQAFEAFTEAVAGAYLLDDRVRRALGYPGQRAITFDADAALAQAQELTENVVAPPSLHGPFGDPL